MSELANAFKRLWESVHSHHDVQAVEHVVEELLALEGRLAELERLVRELVPGASGLPQLPDLTPTRTP